MRLAVELYGSVVGSIEGDARTFDFVPSEAGIDRFGSNSSVLSVAIPLVAKQRGDHAQRRRNWFGELLPEGDQYDFMLAQAALRRGDTPVFLGRFGRDVAGALQIWDLDDPSEPRTPSLRKIDAAQIRALLEDPISAPLGNAAVQGRTSLGGVQPKIALTRTPDGWAQALGGYPTTHILKPRVSAHPTMIFDEEYGSRLARGLGLSAFDAEIQEFAGLDALVIERFDRRDGVRIHQEDLSQALGAGGNQKYQEIGGVVSLARAASVLQRHASGQDLRNLAAITTLGVAIGNLDMHTKNLGLLHPEDGEVRLAPAYDMVPHAPSTSDGRLALAIDGEYRHHAITSEHLRAEFELWGVRRAGVVIDEVLDHLVVVLDEEDPVNGARPEVQDDIRRAVSNLRTGRPVGAGR